jgi:hypothetical protein
LAFLFVFMQGGLIGLAAATVGLTSDAAQHLSVSDLKLLYVTCLNLFCDRALVSVFNFIDR